jgi:transposase InsO family protein
MRNAISFSGGLVGVSRRRLWRCGLGLCWPARRGLTTRGSRLSWGVPRRQWVNGALGSSSIAWVARVMRERGIAGLRLRRKVRTTIPEPNATPVADLLKRDFTAQAANTIYVGDITYLPYDGGNLYLATVIDCYSRRLVGWSIADHMRTELISDALLAAQQQRGTLTGAVFHSDHGAQYVSRAYAELCQQLGVTQSMGAVGTSADNALAESFNASLKRETLQGAARWTSADHARREVFKWITRYNTQRRHSYCGYLSPSTYENTTTAATLRTELPLKPWRLPHSGLGV